jgi:phage terminase large subunit-like protein
VGARLQRRPKIYVLDMVRDRLNLTERTAALFACIESLSAAQVGYEKYGKDADIAHIKSEMERAVYSFDITELGGSMPKNDRIRRLIPMFEQGRVRLPRHFNRTNYEGKSKNLTQVFIDDEYRAFPVAVHDDMLDALARMEDEDITVTFPMAWDNDDDFDDESVNSTRSSTTGY